jgi:hypothetical protein
LLEAGAGKRKSFPEVINQVFQLPALGSTCALSVVAHKKRATTEVSFFVIIFVFLFKIKGQKKQKKLIRTYRGFG